jgi:methylated-DNA-[protein]-cysteine S-methyltransferase
MMEHLFCYNTPIGRIGILDDGRAITEIRFLPGARNTQSGEPGCSADTDPAASDRVWEETELIREAFQELSEYFKGFRKEFQVPLNPRGTEFQQSVWKVLQSIPYGETRSYGQVAAEAGNPKAARAVGMANNRNPIPIMIPCHRVIGADGRLIGYGGGLPIKEYLLRLEKKKSNA